MKRMRSCHSVNMDGNIDSYVPSAGTSSSNINGSGDEAKDSYKNIHRFFVEQSRIAKTLPIDDINLNNCDINSILRPYQKETVQWLIMRETTPASIQSNWSIDLPRGGILADEMGLGKTVEILACILGNSKLENDRHETSIDIVLNESTTTRSSLLGKRPNQRKPSFLKKKTHLSQIKQNPTLKVEIKNLLSEYVRKFRRKFKEKLSALTANCQQQLIDNTFSVLILHRYYKEVDIEFARQQTWAYLISEFDAHEDSSLAYAILLKESPNESDTLPENSAVSDEDASRMMSLVNEYLTDKILNSFKTELYRAVRRSVYLTGSEFIPLLEDKDVQCRCGSDKAKGRKIRCSKCLNKQHRECVGLSNKITNDDKNAYYCPSCWMKEQPIQSAATLIVIPDALTQQWTEEIKKHAADRNLKVFWYKGVSKGYVLPNILGAYDIVLITTCKLTADLSFVNPNTRSLRHVKRYQQFVTPLTCIRWWRLCIDEAQSVEGVNKVSEMASRLQTEHLWAVTGTPIGKSLRDLYWLAVYLRMDQFVQSDLCWKELTSGDQSGLHLLYAHLMRRKTKAEVEDQIRLPDLTYDLNWLSFPPVEGYFYNATHVASQTLFLQTITKKKIKDWNYPLKKANRALVDSILAPLLSLRLACVNPMVCSMNVFNLRKKETFQNLLEKMIKKTKVDCDDLLRLYVMLVNGAARLHLLADEMHNAVTLYRSILAKFSIYVDLKPDDFQLIHIMHNVCEAASRDLTIELTDEEEQFPRKIIETETKCLDKLQDEIDTMKTQLSKYSKEIQDYVESFGLSQFSWWERMLCTFNFDDVTKRILEDLHRDNIKLDFALKLKLSSAERLRGAIKYWLSDVEQKRSVTFDYLEQITNVTSRDTLWAASDQCHLRNSEPTRTCSICRMEDLMLKYEALLFNIGDRDATKDESNWKPTALESALHVLLACSRTLIDPMIDNTKAGHQLKALAMLKREFRAIRAIWSRQCDLLNVADEIRTAKSTLESKNASSDILQPGTEIFAQELDSFGAQSTSAYLKLQSKYGSFQYLKNLDKRYKSDENFEETCPVCHMSMDEKRAVMTCGHFTCFTCMQALIQHSHRDHISCPVCRAPVPLTSISYVHGGGTSDLDMSNVIGNYSIKILAITAKVLELIKEDPSVKILVFSTWERILITVEKAFVENKIRCEKYSTGEKRRSSLASFKTKDDVNALLMPLGSGGKGLNLTEASHVIFAEPVLHTADEKQAIGRIYRMGQQKSMVVHKFVIKSSVEEHIHKMNEELLQSSSDTDYQLTFQHLRDLFEASSSNLPTV